MESIYKQMNNIDDEESLNEKYNVRTLKDVRKLNEDYFEDEIDDEAAQEFYARAEEALENHFHCTGAYLEPSVQAGEGGLFLFADDVEFDGSVDFQTSEEYVRNNDFDGFLKLCKNSFRVKTNESLDKKYNVRNQRELKKLKEYWQSSQDHCRKWIAEGMYDFVLKHLHPEIHAFVADTCRINVDKQHPDIVVVLKMINDASFIARVERMNRTGSNSNSIDFCEPYTVEISKQQPHCKELYTVTDKLCADYNNAVKLIQQNELVLVGKGKSAVWTRFSTNDSAEVAYNKQKS